MFHSRKLTGQEKNPLQDNNLYFVQNVDEDNLGINDEIHFLKLKKEGEMEEADGEVYKMHDMY